MEKEEKQTFILEDENGRSHEAEIITMLSIEGREYLVYSIQESVDVSNICASKVVKDENGDDKLVDIDNESDKAKIAEFIKTLSE